MKTLHVETGRHLYGGAQQVLYLVRGLVEKGGEVLLASPPDSAIAAAAAAGGITVREVDCASDLDLSFLLRLHRLIKAYKPDIVHCHSRRGADFLGGQAASMASVPAILSRRVDNPEPRFFAAFRYRRFRRIIAISEAIRETVLAAGVDPGKISVIRSAVDTARFEHGQNREALARVFGLDPSRRLLLSAAQLIERKGQRFQLDALSLLAARFPDLDLVICGQGPDEDELKRYAAELGIADRVHFAGFRDDLDDYLGCFDLLVHTALAEGLGVILLKAAAAGLPAVAFDAGGVPEAVAHGETGLLVPPADAQALADALASLLDDSERHGRYARRSRERAKEEFSTETMVDAHIRLYSEVLQG